MKDKHIVNIPLEPDLYGTLRQIKASNEELANTSMTKVILKMISEGVTSYQHGNLQHTTASNTAED